MKNLTLIALAFLSMLACKKPTDDPDKPPQAIGDMLWCKVNGTPHLYEGKPTMLHHDGVHVYQLKFSDSSSTIQIFADNTEEYNDAIDMHINVTDETGNVPLTDKRYKISDNHPYRYSEYYANGGYNSYQVDSGRSYVNFTAFSNTIAAGNFEYHGFNKNNDTVHITEGIFNIVRE